jgi:hypothetical protein
VNDTEHTEEEDQHIGETLHRVYDPEWDKTHLTIACEGGDHVWRIAHEELKPVRKRPKETPIQPPIGYGASFSDFTAWWRSNDGLWYLINKDDTEEPGLDWLDLWDEHGDEDWKSLVPLRSESMPFLMPMEGPTGEITLPDISSGEPQPGMVAFVDPMMRLTIRNVQTGAAVVLDAEQTVMVLGMAVRTYYSNRRTAFFGPEGDDGDENLIVGE